MKWLRIFSPLFLLGPVGIWWEAVKFLSALILIYSFLALLLAYFSICLAYTLETGDRKIFQLANLCPFQNASIFFWIIVTIIANSVLLIKSTHFYLLACWLTSSFHPISEAVPYLVPLTVTLWSRWDWEQMTWAIQLVSLDESLLNFPSSFPGPEVSYHIDTLRTLEIDLKWSNVH